MVMVGHTEEALVQERASAPPLQDGGKVAADVDFPVEERKQESKCSRGNLRLSTCCSE